jgi:hypothetical protein
MSVWNLWFELGYKAKNIEIAWFMRRLSDLPPTDERKIAFIERELTAFRHILLIFSDGDIFIAYGRIEELEKIIKSCD